MPDAVFDEPRLAAIYDDLDPDRSDLDAYAVLAAELGARRVLDIGCGTGTFALMLAAAGMTVTGVDPAAASIEVARAKPGAGSVTWIHGDAGTVADLEVDLVTMTANVAQAIVDQPDWAATLAGAWRALRPGGHLIFETRDPARQAWLGWGREHSHEVVVIDGVGEVEVWCDVLDVSGALVTFRWTHVFGADGAVLTSHSTLRFRERDEVAADLVAAGFVGVDVRDAPDRPGREFVFLAQRPPDCQAHSS